MSALLRVSELCVSFGGVHAVRDLDVQVVDGEAMAIVGPNGAGKTTAFNAISGHIKDFTGSVQLRGQSIAKNAPWRIARRGMTRTFQNGGLFADLTIAQNLALGRRSRTIDARCHELLDLISLDPTIAVGSLAYGQQKSVEIGRALATDPEVLLLDEPASGVAHADLPLLRRMVATAIDSGIAVVAIEHNITFVRDVFPRTLVMANGAGIADGPTAEVLERTDVLEAYFGVSR